jgi:hypothetical protein
MAEALHLNTTLTSLDLCNNGLGEGGGRVLAEALRLNTTVTSSLDLSNHDWEGEERHVSAAKGLGRLSRSKKSALRLCPWKVRGGSGRAPFSCSPPCWAADGRRVAATAPRHR